MDHSTYNISADDPDYKAENNVREDAISTNTSLFFTDGMRSVDFILVYQKHFNPNTEKTNSQKRRVFLENLISQGLDVEVEYLENEITFIKLHTPFDILRRYAEILKLRMPMQEVNNV